MNTPKPAALWRTPYLRTLKVLGGPMVASWALAWLMVLLVLGTLAQAHIGLYQSQKIYFSAWVFWAGPLPLPGGAATLALLGLGLTIKMVLYPWRRAQWGSLLAHMAVWLLLVGGLATSQMAQEGYLRITEGQSSNVLESYHTPELAVVAPSPQSPPQSLQGAPQAMAAPLTLQRHPVEALKPGARLPVGEGFVHVEAYYPNSQLAQREEPVEDGLTRGARRIFAFTAKALETDEERNRPTLLFTLEDSATRPLAKLVLFQNQPIPQPVAYSATQSATLVLRPQQQRLPFAVALQRFEAEVYPGTRIPRHYASVVEVISPQSGRWPAYIRMNAPLRYGGYTLYQASFMGAAQAAGPNTTILAVVKNQGYLIPYASGLLLCLGLGLHVLLRWRRKVAVALLLVPLLWPMAGMAQPHKPEGPHATQPAPHALPMGAFGLLPIQHEGRLKPINTFAELTLHSLHGRTHGRGQGATAWLAEVVFTPQVAMGRPLFQLPSPALQERLGLPPRKHRVYRYTELVPAMRPHFMALQRIAALPAPERDPLDAQLLTLAENMQLFFSLSQTGMETPQTPEEQEAAPFRIHPPRLAEELWLPPLAAPETPYRMTWAAMALAYQKNDARLWDVATAAATRQAAHMAGVRPLALKAEWALRALHPFGLATGLFALAFLLASWRGRGRHALRLAPMVLSLGWGVATLALAARVYILQRPPVGTLYESVVFVGCICVLGALLAAWKSRAFRQRWLQIGALCGMLIQAVGVRYAAAGGDTLGVLVAVLDTSFWLTIHVLVITAGYGVAILAGAWAHGLLFARFKQAWGRGQAKGPKPAPLFSVPELRTLYLLLLLALALVATGTLLGGIWADQSWGRFWGWDPKENGALLLTLWLVWVLHARLAGLLGPLGLVVSSALGLCVVALAWFGVNMLGIGLHSYGFTKGTLLGLVGFIGVELIAVGLLAWPLRQRAQAPTAKPQRARRP